MYFVSFHMNGAEWFSRTEVLTRTTTYATALVDSWKLGGVLVIGIHRDHHDGASGTVAGAVATLYPIGEDDTVFL